MRLRNPWDRNMPTEPNNWQTLAIGKFVGRMREKTEGNKLTLRWSPPRRCITAPVIARDDQRLPLDLGRKYYLVIPGAETQLT